MNSLYISNNVFLLFLFGMVDTRGNFGMDIFFLFLVLLKKSITHLDYAYIFNNIVELLEVFKKVFPERCPVLEAHISSDVVFMNGLRKAFFSEAIAWRCSVKKVFLQISQNSQENQTKEKKHL